MNAFWKYVHLNTLNVSEVSGRRVSDSKSTMHHAFAKSPYPELKYSIGNIMRVTWEEHQCLNEDQEYFEQARKKRAYILENWSTFVEESTKWSEEYDSVNNEE